MKLIKFLFIFLVMGTKFTYAYDPSDFDRWKLKFKSDVNKLHLLYNQLEEVKKYGDVNQGLGTWNGYEYIKNKQKGKIK